MTRTLNPLRPVPGEPRPYHVPPFERRTLANGLTLWLVPLPDRELVNVHLLVDAGASAEDEAHGGIASLTARL
ncbi:MAG TPA: insulinase family protein, partial [Candidatus Limnocylindria bacterium]|nr:insulinase family protein [Candidatus Limnocylindria bacterium]